MCTYGPCYPAQPFCHYHMTENKPPVQHSWHVTYIHMYVQLIYILHNLSTYYTTYLHITQLIYILHNLYTYYTTYIHITQLIYILHNLSTYYTTYIHITQLIYILHNLYTYYTTYLHITQLIYILHNLYTYYTTYIHITQLIYVYTYSSSPDDTGYAYVRCCCNGNPHSKSHTIAALTSLAQWTQQHSDTEFCQCA